MFKALSGGMAVCVVAGLATFSLSAAPAGAGELRLTTLDWCPYTCAGMAGGGVTTEVVRRLTKADGDGLAAETLPWQRAVATAQETGMQGYYPEYPGPQEQFTLSQPIGVSPLGLAHRKDAPVSGDIAALGKLKVGVVAGYINGEKIDAAIRDGRIKADEAKDDATNLRKLAAGRIDVAVIDRYVMAWLLNNDETLKPLASQIVFGPEMERLTLHIAFNKSAPAQAAAQRLDQRIAVMDPLKMQAELFAAMLGM